MGRYKSPVDAILKDIEDIFEQALAKANFSVALKAKELLGREQGLFLTKRPPSKKETINLADLSEEDLLQLIQQLESKLNFERSGKNFN
ncbi:MAG: hypothetical protein K2P93_09370 [Alphaproteobacteria bacterium]|nr:hypothetical protein [Alphaproteobacteria bacterium]